jgi:hypothetical protein
MRRSPVVLALLVSVLALSLVGCGADDEGSRPPTTTVQGETVQTTEDGDEGEAGEEKDDGKEKGNAKGKDRRKDHNNSKGDDESE